VDIRHPGGLAHQNHSYTLDMRDSDDLDLLDASYPLRGIPRKSIKMTGY